MNFTSQPSVSIVIPVYKGGEKLNQCLTSLAQIKPLPKEIIVVADGNNPEDVNIARQFKVKLLTTSVNRGPARARNLGVKAASGDIIFFVDADVTVDEKAISKIIECFTDEPDVAALIGSYDDQPGEHNFLSQYKNLFHHYTHQIASETASTFWGACGVIRRDVFLSIGGFDPRYLRPCVEDIELGYRLKAAGYKIKLCKELQVKHLKRWEIISLLKAEVFYRAIPWTELILRDRAFNNDLNLNQSSRWSVILSYAFILTLGCIWLKPELLAAAGVMLTALISINASVYQFFLQKRGWLFTLKVIPWHLFYYLYGGLGFAVGSIRYQLGYAVLDRQPLSLSRLKF